MTLELTEEDINLIKTEISYKTFIVSGPGGQNRQKSATGADLTWDVADSRIRANLKSRIIDFLLQSNRSVKLQFKTETHRSLDLNKKESFNKLLAFLKKALYIPKKRVATRPTYSSKVKKLNSKKLKGEIKRNRQKIKF